MSDGQEDKNLMESQTNILWTGERPLLWPRAGSSPWPRPRPRARARVSPWPGQLFAFTMFLPSLDTSGRNPLTSSHLANVISLQLCTKCTKGANGTVCLPGGGTTVKDTFQIQDSPPNSDDEETDKSDICLQHYQRCLLRNVWSCGKNVG